MGCPNNGEPATGDDCDTDGAEKCSSCDTGYSMILGGTTCEVTEGCDKCGADGSVTFTTTFYSDEDCSTLDGSLQTAVSVYNDQGMTSTHTTIAEDGNPTEHITIASCNLGDWTSTLAESSGPYNQFKAAECNCAAYKAEHERYEAAHGREVTWGSCIDNPYGAGKIILTCAEILPTPEELNASSHQGITIVVGAAVFLSTLL